MRIDVIPMSEGEFNALNEEQQALVRTAQKKRNELYHKAAAEFEDFKKRAYADGMRDSSVIADKEQSIYNEAEYNLDVIAEQLKYDLALSGVSVSSGYYADYALNYVERYARVRNYYLKIENVQERLAKYDADETAMEYLGTYYDTLREVLATTT